MASIPEIQKFRSKFPDYDDLDDRTLADMLASKFPDYSDLPEKVRSSSQAVQRQPDISLEAGVDPGTGGFNVLNLIPEALDSMAATASGTRSGIRAAAGGQLILPEFIRGALQPETSAPFKESFVGNVPRPPVTGFAPLDFINEFGISTGEAVTGQVADIVSDPGGIAAGFLAGAPIAAGKNVLQLLGQTPAIQTLQKVGRTNISPVPAIQRTQQAARQTGQFAKQVATDVKEAFKQPPKFSEDLVGAKPEIIARLPNSQRKRILDLQQQATVRPYQSQKTSIGAQRATLEANKRSAMNALKREVETVNRQLASESDKQVLRLRKGGNLEKRFFERLSENADESWNSVEEVVGSLGDQPIPLGDVSLAAVKRLEQFEPQRLEAVRRLLHPIARRPEFASKSTTATAQELMGISNELGTQIRSEVVKGNISKNYGEILLSDLRTAIADAIENNAGTEFKGFISAGKSKWMDYATDRDRMWRYFSPGASDRKIPKSGVDLLKRIAKGKASDDELRFIERFNDLIGEDVTMPLADHASKLRMLSDSKIVTQPFNDDLAAIQQSKQAALDNLKRKQFEIEQMAEKRANTRKIAFGVGGVSGVSGLGLISKLLFGKE